MTKLLKAVAIDDEVPALDSLNKELINNGQVEVTGQFFDHMAALKNIQEIKPDIVFLDIELPEINGLKLAELITKVSSKTLIVFVTACTQYAIDAFKVNAVDYILKPVNKSEIDRVVLKLKKRIRIEKVIEKYAQSQSQPQSLPLAQADGRILCLGSFKVFVPGKPEKVHWTTSKVEELFCYFIVHSNKKIDKWMLCELLWPNLDPEKARNNLYTSVYRLKKIFIHTGLPIQISSSEKAYEIKIGENCPVDYKDFEQAVASIKNVSEENLIFALQVENMYKEELFDNKGYQWAYYLSEYLNEEYNRLIIGLVNYYTQLEDDSKVIYYLKKSLYFYPYEEVPNKKLMEIYLKTNNKTRLINHYNYYKRLMQKELGVEPSLDMKKLYQEGNRI